VGPVGGMLASMRKKVTDLWSAIRQLLSLRSLLDVLGLRGFVMAALTVAALAVWSYVERMPAPTLAVLTLLCFVLVLLAWFLVRVSRMIPTPLHGSQEAATTPDQAARQARPTPADSPEIVIDYIYAEDSKDHHDANAPLVVRNISRTARAYNVEVLPLKTAEGVVTFDPGLIPYIEAPGESNVFAFIADGSPLFRRRLPEFLYRSYKDTSAQELFGTKVFTIQVRYKGTGTAACETECELQFRPWKKQTTVGRITRRALPETPSSQDLAKTTRSLRENLRTLHDRYGEASDFCKYPLSKIWRPYRGTLDYAQDIRDGLEWTKGLTELLTNSKNAFTAGNKLSAFADLLISAYLTKFLDTPYADCIDALWKLEEAIKNSL